SAVGGVLVISLAARALPLPAVLATCLCLAPAAPAQLLNGSFESGDFSGWTPTDLSAPLTPLAVVPISTFGYFGTTTAPTDGDYSVATGFDGNGPGTISVAQDVTVSKSSPLVLLDYRAQWDLVNYGGGAQARTFSVVVESPGGGFTLGSFEVLRA